MPELPEVETYVRELAPVLSGRQVIGAQVLWPRTIAAPAPANFVAQIRGQRFHSFGRRGKYMLLGLESGLTLIVHLRMTGHLLLMPPGAAPDKHMHVVMALDDGRNLVFQDTRKFGRLWLVSELGPVLDHLGPEPLDGSFMLDDFVQRLAGRKAAVKALLLDQTIVAGVGNIYADEALFAAGIHPTRSGGSLSRAEAARLQQAIQNVLAAGIARAGSSLGGSALQNYVRPGGEQGEFQAEHNVFQRTGKPCPTCATPVERIVLAQRGTHFCPHCQR
ncbi:MAG: bifunctional DNA-formamidopyrimidine glycosylase/DNA-(apurinic or apyrimidinic site) lyase [Caldilineaceae bacterium]|nr:bifunctional DNA-formamidopyrimidine glycosylase/DNA-(apurinic or apyrimidinic site) lyase [Caldilineaceae bacterium]